MAHGQWSVDLVDIQQHLLLSHHHRGGGPTQFPNQSDEIEISKSKPFGRAPPWVWGWREPVYPFLTRIPKMGRVISCVHIRWPPLWAPPGCEGSCVIPFPVYHVFYVPWPQSQDSWSRSQDIQSRCRGSWNCCYSSWGKDKFPGSGLAPESP